MVELRDFQLHNFFRYKKTVFRVEEKHLLKAQEICKLIDPIPISSPELILFNFHTVRLGDFNHWEIGYNGMTMYLKAATMSRWMLQIGGEKKLRYVSYIHQLQNVFYHIFEDELIRSGYEKK